MKRRVFLSSILSVFSIPGIGLISSSVVHAQSLAAVTTSPGAPLVAIDPGSGKVRTLVPSTGATQAAFHPSAIDATGRRLFFLGAPGAGSSVLPGIFTVDLATGAATSHYIQGSQGPISFLEYDASRRVLLSVANAPGAPLLSIDPATGVETVLVPSTGAMAAFLGTIDAAGRRLFFLGGTGMSGAVPALFTIDLDTLAVSIRQISVDRLAFLRYDAGTGRLLSASNSVGVPIVAIDPATGDVTTLVAATGALTAGDGAVDVAGRRLYFMGGGLSQSLFTVDLSTLSISHASIARTDSYVFMQFDPFGVRSACGSDAFTLCLNQGRFSVSVAFRTTDIPNGAGASIFLTADAGAFWFFTPNNIELVVKVVDGRAFNGHFWVFGADRRRVHDPRHGHTDRRGQDLRQRRRPAPELRRPVRLLSDKTNDQRQVFQTHCERRPFTLLNAKRREIRSKTNHPLATQNSLPTEGREEVCVAGAGAERSAAEATCVVGGEGIEPTTTCV